MGEVKHNARRKTKKKLFIIMILIAYLTAGYFLYETGKNIIMEYAGKLEAIQQSMALYGIIQ